MHLWWLTRRFLDTHVYILVALTILGGSGHGYMIGNNPYHLRESLDSEGKYQLEWLVDWSKKEITFNITAHTTGFVGFGLSDNGKMTGADIVIGGVDSKGRTYFADYHAVGHQTPVRDPSQDWQLLSGQENGTHTFLSFSRPFDTCDPQDYAITEDRIAVIWSFGARDEIRYHHGNRGMFHVYLLNPDYSPEIITEPKTGVQRVLDDHGHIDKSVNVWTVHREMELPNQETLYWCTMHKAPRLRKKNHVIGFNVRFDNEVSRRHVHHFVVSHCNPPRGSGRDARSMFEPFVNTRGQQCLTMPTGPMPVEYCSEMMYIWAVGGRAHFNPPHVGFPFQSEGYYTLQIHLDNPALITNTQISVSLDFFYTEKLRPNEGGFFGISHDIPGLPPSFLIPPLSINQHTRGICGSECSKEMLPPEGVLVYGAFLHTHNAGRKVRLRHFRNNKELPFMGADENYSAAYQQVRNFPEERRVLRGDQIVGECVYDSTRANGSVVGGLATRQEMCLITVLHYQRLVEIVSCGSQIESPDDRRHFLAGVENVTWSDALIEYVAAEPHPLAGMPISEVSDNHVDWTLERREELERFHLFRPHVNRCPRQFWTLGQGAALWPGAVVGVSVTYPHGAKPYQAERPCNLDHSSKKY